jgi:hypothetical protein
MAITLTLSELKGMEQPLTKLLEQQISVKAGFKLSKILKNFSKELGEIEDQRQKLIRQYGETVDNQITITNSENLEKFHNEFSELLKEEITFEYDPMSIDLLGDVNLTVAEIAVLSVLFTD